MNNLLKQIDELISQATMENSHYYTASILKECRIQLIQLKDALEKIADPRKRDHREPDAYTELGCVMHIAQEALDKLEEK